MTKKFRYKNIFMYASLQFCGHMDEYFIKHTEKLVVFLVMPRLKSDYNIVRVYRKGKLRRERLVWSSSNIILYYLAWYVNYLTNLFYYFSRSESLIVLSNHPISFFGMSFQKMLRRMTFAYWVGDYFPPVSVSLLVFESFKKYYHDRVTFTYYLSDRINRLLNGKIAASRNHATVMWGVKRVRKPRITSGSRFTLLFIGLIKEGQGLEFIFSFLSKHKDYFVNIIGICDETLFRRYANLIRTLGVTNQVFFPNTFYSDAQLIRLAKTCYIGVAMYDTSPLNSAYFTDPGKVKAYVELGLPVIMSDTTSIAPFVKKYRCGEVIENNEKAFESAALKIQREYVKYCKGLQKFIYHFYFETYYKRAFGALE